MGLGQKIFGLGLENFFRSKKISSGRVKKYPGQSMVNLVFTTFQNYARNGSVPITI